MNGEGERTDRNESGISPSPCQSFASAIGFALGELLVFTGRTDELAACLRCIHTTAYASVLSADLEASRRVKPRKELPDAAIASVRTWHEEMQDLNVVRDAVATLQDELSAASVPYVAPGSDEE